ncbi:hypothetical protein ACRE_060640 [Hapsidospora chrysogenum ATCC 11550]|uniref:Cell wall galactomannoprotein n=1 Tax=Hapsidospora chrysogenum (strain ATCC 11550 / CBS 779.69 / DSM 880 / IAM 14645 / JCM 23072 / IMI 49137) TaxID=857340 RepID=A0A086T1H0_HAPC1|nr:hypothetical protein ACRE_060640 [Hapsidospora chrysogenum ATCC 11550]
MNLKIWALAILAATATADEYTHKILADIRQAIDDFHQGLSGWDGTYTGAVRVAKQSYDLKKALGTALSPASKELAAESPHSPELEQQTLQLARDLADEIGQVIDTAIESKPKMEAIPFAGKRVGVMVFKSLHGAATNLGQEFSPRASDENQETAQDIVREIDEHFLRGLAAFE